MNTPVEITNCTHAVVLNEDGSYVLENNILLQDINTGNLVNIPLSNQIKEIFGFQVHEAITTQCKETTKKQLWTRDSTLKLIDLIKKNQEKFTSTAIKNDTVYNKISADLCGMGLRFSSSQCKDRHKYLKLRFAKKVDNMNNSTGASPITFEYYDEMYDIYGKKPNIVPVAIASSSKRFTSADNFDEQDVFSVSSDSENVENITNNNLAVKKRKRMRPADGDIERRHKERMELLQKAIDTFSNKIDKLIEKL